MRRSAKFNVALVAGRKCFWILISVSFWQRHLEALQLLVRLHTDAKKR
jgi:hypothetical protein